ncbi:MAG TPA: DUF177 domain-containing protein [Thermoanaerobaculia bacterium]|nr:DUF177 domain-containing protein [Thermoanaerobaculia bacterium]
MNDIIDFDVIDEHGPQTYRGTYPVSVAEIARVEVAGEAQVMLEATVSQGHTEGEYLADGEATVTVDLNCSRCVEPTPFANTSRFHVRFQPRPEVSSENEEIEITDKEELDVEFYSQRTVPLRDLAFEQVQLAIPMKPLCDENCLGLCAQCGANRSREACKCDESIVDERWGALKAVAEQLKKKES